MLRVSPRAEQDGTWQTLPLYYNNCFMGYKILHATAGDAWLWCKGVISSRSTQCDNVHTFEVRTRCNTEPRDKGCGPENDVNVARFQNGFR